MHLKHIKLAGFKSFVDPTIVAFPSHLCAVVGPNGCGKSNVIDAVRWVMGESSAKYLRGESITDIIFNGSSSRKPIGQASVELVFDNSDGALKGEYLNDSDIAIKRKVTRDGKNTYFLNGSRCRRRDITDIFLGTGLGPRSYGIIEQGIISRLIEAKPEELRMFIEEAAGISKYKDRRRDTENRMRRTLENLERLADISAELQRRLTLLKRQSQLAEKYQQLKREQRQLQASLQALRYHLLERQANSQQVAIQAQEVTIERILAQQVHQDSLIEKCRAQHSDKTEIFREIQTRFYAIGTDIARIEQTIHHQQEKYRQLQADIARADTEWQQAQAHLQADRQKADSWQLELADIEPQLAQLSAAENKAAATLQAVEEEMQDWQQTWDHFNQRAVVPQRQSEVEKSRIQQLQKLQARLSAHRAGLQQERTRLQADDIAAAIDPMKQQLAILAKAMADKRRQIDSIREDIQQLRNTIDTDNAQLDRDRSELQTLRGRYASLEALQQDALNSGDQVNQWLHEQNMAHYPRLIDQLTVTPRWQYAVEKVLGSAIQAIAIDSIDTVAHALHSFVQGELAFTDNGDDQTHHRVGVDGKAPLLAEHVTANSALKELLSGIYISDNLDQALALRKQLADGESVVTPEGFWLGAHWLRIIHDKDRESGVLARRQTMQLLMRQIAAAESQVADRHHRLQRQSDQLQQLEQARDQHQRNLDNCNKEHAEAKSQLTARETKLAHNNKRLQQINRDIAETEAQLTQEQNNLSQAHQLLEEATQSMAKDEHRRQQLSARRDQIHDRLKQERQRARQSQQTHHTLAMQQQRVATQLQSIHANLERLTEHSQSLQQRRQQLSASLRDNQEPVDQYQETLASLLQQRLHTEASLADARSDCEQLERQQQQAEHERGALEKQLKKLGAQLQQLCLNKQTTLVEQQTLARQFDDSEGDLKMRIGALPADAKEQTFEQSLQDIADRIERLGPINLAAIDDYRSELERKHYLDSQENDLREALATLESAIEKIDGETRLRFKETYERVNHGLNTLFPKIFDGGHAHLQLIGDDLLDTGVTIMAQPPGKRNSTIHLLSGGEKALTAIALIFSIFQLNPAPFCMLDEVDAPLDDVNANRYSRLLEEMSDKVQFIYITHNKISMEIARQLIGVTMHEAGVSRLVTVDVDEAIQLAAQ